MPTLQDLINKLNDLPKILQETIPGELDIAAKDYIALQVTHVRREGVGRYSNKKVPAYLFKGKNDTYPNVLNGAGRSFIDKKIKEGKEAAKSKQGKFKGYISFGASSAGLINWKMLRVAQGLQGSYVDLSYSNHMLNNIGVTSKQSTLTRYTANIGGLTDEARKKLGYNYKRYGQFMNPSLTIRQTVGKAVALRVGRFISNKLSPLIK